MGKGNYLGGHTIVKIYDEELNLVKKIYRALHDDIKKYHITILTIKNCFKGYQLEEVLEVSKFNLPEKDKILEILIDYHKKHNKKIFQKEDEEETKKKVYKYTLTRNDYIEFLKYDLDKLELKIKKYPTNNSLKKDADILKNKIEALKNSESNNSSIKKKKEKKLLNKKPIVITDKKVKNEVSVKKEKNQKEKKVILNKESNMYLALIKSGIIKE